MADGIYGPSNPRYPDVHVPLVGHDGNAFSIIGRVRKALLKHGADKETVEQYIAEATSGDYDNLLYVTMCWVDTL